MFFFLCSSCLLLFLGSPLYPVAVMRFISRSSCHSEFSPLDCHSERKRRIFPPASIRFSLDTGGCFLFFLVLLSGSSFFVLASGSSPDSSSHPIRDTPFSADFPVSLPRFPSLLSNSNPRHILFCRFPCVATLQAYFLVSLLPCNSLFFRHFPNPRAPQMRHALPVIA